MKYLLFPTDTVHTFVHTMMYVAWLFYISIYNLNHVCMYVGIVDETIIDFKTRRLGQSASDSVLKMKEVSLIHTVHTYIDYIHTYIGA